MDFAICSYSFHRRLEAGQQDLFSYIQDCRALGCTHLDPWSGHFAGLQAGNALGAFDLTSSEEAYLKEAAAAAATTGLLFNLIAVDGTLVFADDAEARKANRIRARRWLDAAHLLGARQVRLDPGGPVGPEAPSEEVFEAICCGYSDLAAYGKARGVQVLTENHWGWTKTPENAWRLLEAVPDLGFLLDGHNWGTGWRERGRALLAPKASAVHVKAFVWDSHGDEENEDIPGLVRTVQQTGYSGVWSIESIPQDGDELGSLRNAIALLTRLTA